MKTDGRGKGVWIWQIPKCERGDVHAIVAKARAHGLTRVLVKVADGIKYHGANRNKFESLVHALHAANIEPWIWQYACGNHPTEEAAFFAQLANDLDVPAVVVDAEAEYKDKHQQARMYVTSLKLRLKPGIAVGISSFYIPSYHPTFPWGVFCNAADFIMPQVYWFRHDPVWALRKSLSELGKYNKPIIPTLAAYKRFYHKPSQIRTAVAYCNQMGLRGFDFWSWQHAGEARWSVIGEVSPRQRLMVINLDAPEGKQVIGCSPRIEDGRTRADIRPLLESLGYEVNATHLHDQHKIYVRRRT